jgi:hypothetical protein
MQLSGLQALGDRHGLLALAAYGSLAVGGVG